MDDNPERLRASTRKLLDLVEREPVALVIFGHDGQQWKTLKKAPDGRTDGGVLATATCRQNGIAGAGQESKMGWIRR